MTSPPRVFYEPDGDTAVLGIEGRLPRSSGGYRALGGAIREALPEDPPDLVILLRLPEDEPLDGFRLDELLEIAGLRLPGDEDTRIPVSVEDPTGRPVPVAVKSAGPWWKPFRFVHTTIDGELVIADGRRRGILFLFIVSILGLFGGLSVLVRILRTFGEVP